MRILNDMPLGKKLALLATLWLISAVGVFSFLAIRAVNQSTEMMLQDRLATAHVEADYLDQALGRALLAVEDTAHALEIDGAAGELKLQIQTLKDVLSYSRFSIQGIYLTNEAGQIVLSEPDGLGVVGTSISYDSGITQAIAAGDDVISDLVPAPLVGTPVVLLVSPTKEGQQGTLGTLLVALDAAKSGVGSFVRPITLGRTGYIEVVEGNGIVVARTEPGAPLSPFEMSDHSGRFAELISAGQPTRGVCHNCHEAAQKVETRDVLAFAPLTKAHWGVVVRQSEEEALAPVRKLRQNLILTGVGLITITLVLVTITTQDVASRIRLLTTASQRIAGGDFTKPIATSSRKDEVGILANTFEDMRTKLKTSYSELEQRTKELSAMLSVSEILSSLSNLSDLDTTLGTALDKTLETMESNTGGILLLDEEGQTLCYRVYRGLSEKYVQEMCLSLDEGIAGRVAKTGEAILLEDKQAGLANRGLIIGYDTRFASEDFAAAAAEVVAGNGIKVYLCPKATPTPLISFGTVAQKAGGAIIITASHNPAIWNGFKYKSESGSSASTEIVAELEKNINQLMTTGRKIARMPLANALEQRVVEYLDLAPLYFEQVAKLVDLNKLRQAKIKIVVDSMYGAGASYLKTLLEGGAIELIEINSERNPLFPGIQPEPIAVNLSKLSARVKEERANVGLATDGDADRIGVIDENGIFLTTLQVFALLSLYLLEIRGERGLIVRTITTSVMLDRLGELFNVPVCQTPVGFKYVAPIMLAENALIGGEESGGFGFRGHVPERDGILAALYFLDFMVKTGKNPSELINYLYNKVGTHHFNRVDVEFPEEERQKIIERIRHNRPDYIDGTKVIKLDTTDGFHFILADTSWLLIRFSGTEPLLRIYAESSTPARVEKLLKIGKELAGV